LDISAHATVFPNGDRGILAAALPIAVYKFSFGTASPAASGDYSEEGIIKQGVCVVPKRARFFC
jgi:hypothetical protein